MGNKEVLHIKEFTMTGIGLCEIQVFSGENISTPTAHIVKKDNSEEICSVRLDSPEYLYGSNITDEQKLEVNMAMNSTRDVPYANLKVKTWGDVCACWKDLNDKDEIVSLPEFPPDYTQLP